MRVHLSNLGCKLNQAELERLARDFAAAGYTIVGELANADLHIVNSCTVTHIAARDSRKVARRGHRVNPGIKTILTGCYVDGDPEEAASLAGVDLIVRNEDKDALVAEVESVFPPRSAASRSPRIADLPYMPLGIINTRCLVKVEDGCNMTCTFCIIPATRGPQRSRDIDKVVGEVRGLVAEGFQEIVVTGVQISSYRWRGQGLFELVSALLNETEVPRLRLSSIAPWQFDERLLDLFSSGRLCRHLHLSLQSGCNRTLERMRRPYTDRSFAELVTGIRACVPGIAVTTDVIVGFPGEAEEEFAESLSFTETIGFAKVHAFPYSPRPGTDAAAMPGQVPHDVKRERMRRMLSVAEQSERRYWTGQLGERVEVLWERQTNDSSLGMSDNYIRVLGPSSQRANSLGHAVLTRIADGGVEVTPNDDADGRRGSRARSRYPAPLSTAT